MKWFRTTPFSADHNPLRIEGWRCRRDDGSTLDFDVSVRTGKPLDVLSIKGLDLAKVRDYAAFLEENARRLYGDLGRLRRREYCGCCGGLLDTNEIEVLRVFDIPYVRCIRCGHALVPVNPEPGNLQTIFAESEKYSATYVDRDAVEVRLRQIVSPKLQWCLERYAAVRGGHLPRSVIDVGAGGGHFLAGAALQGLRVEGFELSNVSRTFASEVFGLKLRGDDFLTSKCAPADLVTFWGLLEYVDDPASFVSAARRSLSSSGMLIVEVPRVDSLSTAVQSGPSAVVARHMDPTTHINGFSDESLMTLLLGCGFRPVAAWYFGMDIYEVLVQVALRLENPAALESMADLIPMLQQAVDQGRQCDDMIVAAVPILD